MRTIISSLIDHVKEHFYANEDTTDLIDFDSLVPDMKWKFDFALDDFQKRSVYRIELDEFVTVIEHTSTENTVTAEFTFALAYSLDAGKLHQQIKALSNHKHFNFRKIFSQVGNVKGTSRSSRRTTRG